MKYVLLKFGGQNGKEFYCEFIPSHTTQELIMHSIHQNLRTWRKLRLYKSIMISYEKKVKMVKLVFKEKISDEPLKDRISQA